MAPISTRPQGLGFDIDYRKLLSSFQKRGYLLRAYYYTALIEDQEYSSIRPLIDWLDYNGYKVVTKPAKEFTDCDRPPQDQGQHGHRAGGRRAGTRRTCRPLRHLLRRRRFPHAGRGAAAAGRKVSVVSTMASQPPMISDDLRRQADHFIDLMTLKAEIGRDPSERPVRRPEPADDDEDDDSDRRRLTAASPPSRRATARSARGCTTSSPSWRRARAGLVQRAGADLPAAGRRRRGAAADRRAGARPARRQPHRPALHRRLCRRPALRDADRASASRAARSRRGPTTGWSSSAPRSPTRCAACRRRTSRSAPRSPPAGSSWRRRSRAFPNLRAILTLGAIAHQSTVRALGERVAALPVQAWRHGMQAGGITLFSSYHCSRYNTNTGRADRSDVRRRLRRHSGISAGITGRSRARQCRPAYQRLLG